MRKSIGIAALLFYLSTQVTNAQITPLPLNYKSTDKIENLFSTDKRELDLNFKINLSQGVILYFSMTRNGLWTGSEEFKKPLAIAAEQLKLYTDSLKAFSNSKRLDVYINEDNKAITRLNEATKNNNIRIGQSGRLEALKMDNDTLRIVKAFEHKKIRGIMTSERFQYTFEMKELKDFAPIVKNEKWIENASFIIDSVLNVYRQKWHNPDADFHSLYVKYNPLNTENRLFISRRSITDYNRMSGFLIVNGGFGVSLVRNTLCPSANVGIQFHLNGGDDYLPFIRLSMNSFTRFEEKIDKKFHPYVTSFVNAEFGTQTNELNKFNKNFLVSLGLGYKLTTKEQLFRDLSMDKNMYKLFFNYSLSNSIILQPEIISNFKQKEKYNGWIGMTVNFNIL